MPLAEKYICFGHWCSCVIRLLSPTFNYSYITANNFLFIETVNAHKTWKCYFFLITVAHKPSPKDGETDLSALSLINVLELIKNERILGIHIVAFFINC